MPGKQSHSWGHSLLGRGAVACRQQFENLVAFDSSQVKNVSFTFISSSVASGSGVPTPGRRYRSVAC